jgi:hypothetical protein
MGNNIEPNKPSKHFCITGSLKAGEIYNQDYHSCARTVRDRARGFYTDAEIDEMDSEALRLGLYKMIHIIIRIGEVQRHMDVPDSFIIYDLEDIMDGNFIFVFNNNFLCNKSKTLKKLGVDNGSILLAEKIVLE